MIFNSDKLNKFDSFFLINGYKITKIENNNPFWKLLDDYKLYIKGNILCILTNDIREKFLTIEFYLIKLESEFFFSFYYIFINGNKFIDKSITLHNYDSNNIDLLYYKDDIDFIINNQIIFLSNNLIEIEEQLKQG